MPKANRCSCPVAVPNTEEKREGGSEKIERGDEET